MDAFLSCHTLFASSDNMLDLILLAVVSYSANGFNVIDRWVQLGNFDHQLYQSLLDSVRRLKLGSAWMSYALRLVRVEKEEEEEER
jgi:hypothetical protein